MERKGIKNEFAEGLAAPAARALNKVGIKTLEQLSRHSEADMNKLHGVGSSVIKLLKTKLKAKGWSFRGATLG